MLQIRVMGSETSGRKVADAKVIRQKFSDYVRTTVPDSLADDSASGQAAPFVIARAAFSGSRLFPSVEKRTEPCKGEIKYIPGVGSIIGDTPEEGRASLYAYFKRRQTEINIIVKKNDEVLLDAPEDERFTFFRLNTSEGIDIKDPAREIEANFMKYVKITRDFNWLRPGGK